ncbi:MAG: heme-binding protein [Cyclobacteriaceae bacterium]|nr:heme-binding protein [Cyclobacteriaceae bacterium]
MKTKLLLILMVVAFSASAQTTASTTPAPIIQYGFSITLEKAKKIIAAAEAFAASKSYTVVIAIVDTGGNLVALEKIDNTQIGSIEVAIGKAKTANNFKRSTKLLEDAIAGGGVGVRVLSLPATPIEGGEPIYSDGKIIGAIGVSGMTSAQDEEVAKAGLAVNK